MDKDTEIQVAECQKWIMASVSPRKTINKQHSSYWLKHAVEASCKPIYISNEAFIAAAISLGYKPQYVGERNAYFNMSFVNIPADLN